MSRTAEFVARNDVFSRRIELNFPFADISGNNLEFLAGVLKTETMYNVGARHTEPDWNSDRHGCARRYKVVLLRDQANGNGAVAFDGRSKIVFDEFSLEMQCERINFSGRGEPLLQTRADFIGETNAEPDCDPKDGNDGNADGLPFSHSNVTAF